MAYNVRYKIEFVARDGNQFRIEILSDGAPGTVVPLRGAASPIETTEDSSDSIFTPIRKQTGKLMIADNGLDMVGNEFDYQDLETTDILDKQVRLWQINADTSETLRWIGYIKPDSLTSRLFDKVSIREFQLVCPLGAMYDTDISFSNTKSDCGTVKTIGQILHTALNAVGVSWQYVYKQNTVQHREDLSAKISLLNFIDGNSPTHTTPSDNDNDDFTATWTDQGTSWASIIEEVCKFWGWTLYSRGLDIYIVAQNQYHGFAKFGFSDLLIGNNGYSLSDIAEVYVNINDDPSSPGDLTFASTNHTECRQLGYRNITINTNVQEKETVIDPDFQKTDMSYWLGGAGVHGLVHWSNDYYYILQRLGISSGQQDTRFAYFDNYQIEENRMMPNGYNVPFIVYYADGWSQDEFPTKTKFNLSKGIVCYAASTVSRVTFFVKTLEDICLPAGAMLCIQGNAQLSYNPDPDYPSGGTQTSQKPSISDAPLSNANTTGPYSEVRWVSGKSTWDIVPQLEGRKIKVQLSIGTWFWDDVIKKWVNNPSPRPSFELTVREDGSIVSPLNGNTGSGILWDGHYGSNGFCILDEFLDPAETQICGRLKLMILNNTLEDRPADRLVNCVLTSLTIGIYNADSKLYPQAEASHTYKTVASTDFHRDMSVSLSIASGDKNKYGIGQLYNNNLTLLTTVPYRDGTYTYNSMQPEQRLLNMMSATYGHTIQQYTIEVMDNQNACLPRASFNGNWPDSSITRRVLAVSHKWRDGTMKLTLINKQIYGY